MWGFSPLQGLAECRVESRSPATNVPSAVSNCVTKDIAVSCIAAAPALKLARDQDFFVCCAEAARGSG